MVPFYAALARRHAGAELSLSRARGSNLDELGLGPLRRSPHLVLLATTAEKTRAVRALVHGPDLPAWPCSLLHRHPRLDVRLTPAAAQCIHRPEQMLTAWP